MKLRVAYWLVALSAVPLLGGAARLAGLAGVEGVPNHARFSQSPWPVVGHIVSASLFSVLGAFQFESRVRREWPRWHRYAGWVLVPCGLLTAATGVWMTLQYAIPTPLQGSLLFWVRLAVGSGMALSVALAVRAICDGKVRAHQAWMLRAYALGQGAGTQVLFLLAPQLLSGEALTGTPRDLMMTAAWVANVIVAESIVHSHPSEPASVLHRCRRDGPLQRTGQPDSVS